MVQARPPASRLELHMRGMFVGSFGYARHTRVFARGFLDRGIRLELEGFDGGYDLSAIDPDLAARSESLPDARLSFQSCAAPWVVTYPGLRTVNHTMFETVHAPQEWVEIAKTMAMTIVPTTACYEAWADGGVPLSRLRRAPLGVDSDLYTDIGPVMSLDSSVSAARVRMLHVSMVGERKNQAGLLAAWLRATRPDDDAVLIMKVGLGFVGARREWERSKVRAEELAGKRFDQAAPIHVMHDDFPDELMPSLYRAATHYISASHGEGWDLPMIEAAATGLRLIAPDHSAYRDYLDASLATMIPSRVIPTRVSGTGPFSSYFHGNRWWQPNDEALAAAIQHAIDGKPAPDPRLAQMHVRRNFTWDQAVDQLVEVLEEVEGRG